MPFTLQTLDQKYYWVVDKLSGLVFLTAPAPSSSNDPDYYKFSMDTEALFSIGRSDYVGPNSSAFLQANNQNQIRIYTTVDGNNNSMAIGFVVAGALLYVSAQQSGWLQVNSTKPQFFLQHYS